MDKEILNLEETAALLDISPHALREAAARGEVPGRRIATQWRFSRPALHAWLARSEDAVSPSDPWLPFAGIFADSPIFEEVMANIAAERERQRAEGQLGAEIEVECEFSALGKTYRSADPAGSKGDRPAQTVSG